MHSSKLVVSIQLAHRTLLAVAMGIVLLAGLLKLFNLPLFYDSIRSWSSIPHEVVPLIVFLIPSTEFLVSGLWFAGVGVRRIEWLSLFFLIVITIGYCVEWYLAKPPSCGCMGVLSRYLHQLDDTRFILVRNSILILTLSLRTFPISAIRQSAAKRVVHGAGRGYTLIETILVILLIITLISLSLPSLLTFRVSSRETISISNLHGHAVIATQYATDFKSQMPYATTPRTGTVSVVRCLSRRIAIRAGYFEMSNLWHIALADGYYDRNPWNKSLSSPLNFYRSQSSVPNLGTDYFYSCAFLASPEYFNDTTHRAPPAQLRAVRLDEVSFPSAKFVFFDYFSQIEYPKAAAPTAFVDGHAAKTMFADELMYQGGDGSPRESFPYEGHFPGKLPLPHTVDGARGRDTR